MVTTGSYKQVVEEYMEGSEFDVFENANKYPSPTGMLTYVAERALETLIPRELPREVLKLHRLGDIYVHKLPYSLFIPYCSGHSIRRLLLKGLKTPTIVARPAKHLDTYVDHVANYLTSMQHFFSGAQAFSSVELYAGAFIKRDGIWYERLKQQVQRLVYNLNFPSRAGMQCLSEDTKILTPDGWKSYKEIKEGDLIYTFNLRTKRIEVKPVRRVAIYKYEGKMYNLRNRTQNQLISPRHRVVWLSFNNHDIVKYNPIEDLLNYKSPIPIPTPAYTEYVGEDYPLSDEEIKLAAWILSDGYVEKVSKGTPRITLIQSPEKYLHEIKDLLSKLKLEYSEMDDPGLGYAVALRLDAESSRKVLKVLGVESKKPPKWLYRLSRRQARLFIETFVKGDGWIEDGGRRLRIVTTDEEIRDALVAVAVLAGYNVSVSTRKPSDPRGKKTQFIITLTETKTEYIQEIKEVDYKGIIWSVNTENETVIALRDGCVFITGNTPFTNFTVVLDAPKRMLVEEKAVVGGKEDGPLGSYIEEAKLFLKALAEVLAEGDATGRPFTFPIPTIMVTAKSLWEDPEIHEVVFRVAARKGSFYWLNTRLVDPDASFSMCCRINIDRRELMHAMNGGFRLAKKDLEEVREGWLRNYEKQRSGGLWAMPDITGSVGVITVNLPRLALKAKVDDTAFFEGLDEVLNIVREGLTWLRRRYHKLAKEYPHVYSMPLEYLPEVFQLLGGPYFNTVGIIGLPEAVAIMERDPKLWLDGSRSARLRAADWMRGVVQYIVKRAREWAVESGMPFNVEEVPGESAAPKLASRDLREYPELAEYLPDPNNPVYSTSIAPYYADLPLSERVEIEERVQKYFTGGVMMHIFLGEEADPEALASLTKKLMQTDLLYWSYTPAVSVCPKCGWSTTGIVTECPRCHSETEIWSRIIGYYRPLKNWNPARRKEFWLRKHYRFAG